MISSDGFYLRFPLEEIPEKKKAAIGVRGMKLNPKAYVDSVYYTQNAVGTSITVNSKEIKSSLRNVIRKEPKSERKDVWRRSKNESYCRCCKKFNIKEPGR